MPALKKPTEEEINRFLEAKSGDPSFFVLAIYAFIEHYIRNNVPGDKYNEDPDRKEISFWLMKEHLVNIYRKPITNSFIKKYRSENKIPWETLLSTEEMNEIYKKSNTQFKLENEDFWQLMEDISNNYKLSNRVRHDFKKLDPGLIDTAIECFKGFAKHEGFSTKEIEKLPLFAHWDECKPPIDNEQYNKLIADINRVSEAYKDDEEKLEKMTLQLEDEKRKNEIIYEQKRELEEQKAKIDAKYDELRQKRHDLEKEIKELTENNASAEDIKKLEEELASVKQQKDEQETLLSKKQDEINALTEDNISLKAANDTFKQEKEKISKSLENSEKERASIQKKIEVLQAEANKNSETDAELKKLKDDYQKVLAKEEEQEKLLLEKQKKIDSLNESYEDLSLMNEDLAKQKEETELRLKEAVLNGENLLTKIQNLEKNPIYDENTNKELESLKKEYTALQAEQEKQRENLRIIKEEHLRDIETLKKDAAVYIENANILQAYTSANRNYHSRILKLSEDQIGIIEEIYVKITSNKGEYNSDFLIKGGPGTGKTLVLIKLLEKIVLNNPEKKTKLLTYTDSLSKYNQYLSEEYEKKSKDNKKSSSKKTKKIIKVMDNHIETFDSYFKPSISKILGKEIYEINQKADNYKESEEYLKLFSIFDNVLKDFDDNDKNLIFNQALNEIWVFCPTEQTYIDNSFQGENAQLTEKNMSDRKIIWDSVMKVTTELNKQPELPMEFAYWKIATNSDYSILSDEYKLDYLLIDEIQDLSPSRIRLLSKLNKFACIMAGDLNQSVFIKRQLSWIELGMKFKDDENDPNIKKLSNNYRSTIPVQNLANDYRRICKIKDDNAISVPFIPGQKPEFSINQTIEDTFNKILLKIKCYMEVMRFNAKDICIVVPTDSDLIRMKGLLSDNHINALKIDDPKFDFRKANDTIRLSTTKMVKGIDSPVIILLLTEDFTDLSKNGNTDPMSQMNSIYSCITRTMDILSIQVTKKALTSNLDNAGENAITKLYNIWKSSK